ncbi:general glycosylation pathway protein [Guyparkeria halophila]|uniref:General glycosylation pathway protein n=1 Tax=Guyparkeria halophila TaxID=47960 RepID=A0A6I6D425_9GAMM|nr:MULTISPECIES: PDC sensor domain-containing protein [Guyparkeria]QGT78997.1 general glycosylation pathway protein [Guyparkeria halophila]TKA91079.1 general glycosylation pathway protein [Guyparkeria sp. SB14A]
MHSANYISTIDRYHEQSRSIRELIESIITGIGEPRLLTDQAALHSVTEKLIDLYPFVDLVYLLDEDGVQIAEYGADETGQVNRAMGRGKGTDRSQRPYFKFFHEGEYVHLTEPYLSSASRDLCISATLQIEHQGRVGYLVIDVDLEAMISFLLGDTLRRRMEPFFRALYGLFAAAMMLVAGVLFYSSMSELVHALLEPGWAAELRLKPFEVIVVLTLAMAIFDLAKTVFEEEVLMEKDVHRHSTVRRTMTRFVAAILVAILIEGLLTMFKVSMGYSDQGAVATLMVFAAAALLVALGLYVYLGALAEKALLGNNGRSRRLRNVRDRHDH